VTATLIANPYADLHVHPEPRTLPVDPSAVDVITVRCPVRGEPTRERAVDRSGDPELFGFLAGLAAADGSARLESTDPVVPALVELGFLVVEEQVAAPPAYRLPLPPPAGPVPDGLVVGPDVTFQPEFASLPGLDWPVEVVGRAGGRAAFATGPALWIGGPGGLPTAYWLDAEDVDAAAALRPGGPPPPGPLGARLAAAGALRPGRDPLARFSEARAGFAADGTAVVRDVLPAGELAALVAYYRSRVEAGFVPLGDRQNPDRHSWYADPVGRYLQTRLAAAIGSVTGSPARPAFTFFFGYPTGSRLEPHTDRRQAQLSVTLQLDHEPATTGRTGWPLRFRFPDGRRAAADLAPGDMVVYRGREVEHSRDRLTDGRSSVLVLEYVGPEFSGVLA
jgi:hypothetical protein